MNTSFGAVSFGDTVVDLLFISLGVLVAVVLPLLSAEVQALFKPKAAAIDLRKYLILLGFCLTTGLLIFAIYRAANPDKAIAWYTALLAGYGYEATIEKIATP